jgi:ELWxxDGT repeat protein
MIKSFTASSGLGIYYESITIFNNKLYFTANNGTSGKEVWKSNGTTAGTVLLKDINSGSNDGVPWSSYGFFTEVNNELFFIGDNGTNGEELWKTDGTTVGTVMVKDIRSGASGSGINRQTKVGNKLYFTVFTSGSNSLWVSDGTSLGTTKLIDTYYVEKLIELDSSTLIFIHKTTALGKELWISNGTTLGTKLLKDINPGNGDGIYVNYALFLNINGTIFFKGVDGTHGEELWKTNGTDTGTVMVKDITPGGGRGFNNNSEHFFEANGLLFFDGVSQYGSTNTELWQSDGTDTGTIRHNIDTNGGGSHPRKFTLIDTTLFFTANDKFKGIELYAIHVDTIVTTSGGGGSGGGTTFISEKQKQLNITLFPNPTSGKIRIKKFKICNIHYGY